MSELVLREDIGRISVLTLNNPPVNGYTHDLHRALDAHVVDLRMSPDIDVIVLRGAGERFFCAGADIHYLRSLDVEQKYAFCLHANETLLRLEHTPKLVIGALNGHCVGGGLEIALACDLRIGKQRAGKPDQIGLPEVELGVLPGTGGTQRLTRVLGRSKALLWMVEGRKVSMDEAVAEGLIHKVLPEAGWWEAVLAYAQGFCRPNRAAGAVGLIKRAVLGGADLTLESGLALERELQARLFAAPDAAEGLAAFQEKRPPRFTGSGSMHVASPGAAPAGSAGSPEIDLLRTRIPDDVLNLLPRDLVEAHRVVPVRRSGGALEVALADPDDRDAIIAVGGVVNMPVKTLRADPMAIAEIIARYYRA